MLNYAKSAALATLMISFTYVGMVLAQDQRSTRTGGLEEVVVTAQKRSENIQDVAIAITAMSAEMLEGARIETTQDLQLAVPGLVYNQSGARAQLYLRGVGNNLTIENSDYYLQYRTVSSTGTYGIEAAPRTYGV